MNDELLALAEVLAEEEDIEWLAALIRARELLPDLTRAAYVWDAAAFACGNTAAFDVTAN